jgi:hypothetical protein
MMTIAHYSVVRQIGAIGDGKKTIPHAFQGDQAYGKPEPAEKTMANVLDLLKQAILAPGQAGVDALNMHSREIRRALGADGDIAFTEEEMSTVRRHPEGLAALYKMLGQPDMPVAAVSPISALEAIGQAWQVLSGRLDAELGDWEMLLPDMAAKHDALLQHLGEDASCRAGGEAAKRLLAHGLTPAMLYEAFDNIRLLFNRAGRQAGRQDQLQPPSVTLQLLTGASVMVDERRILVQIAGTRDLARDYPMHRLMRWMMTLLDLHPFLIDGYGFDVATRVFYQVPDGPRAQPLSGDALARRWCLEPADLLSMPAARPMR